MLLTGKIALIAGIGPGLGAATAAAMADAGADIVLLARSTATMDPLQRDIAARGRRALALRCDITDADACRDAVAEATAALGAPDILVNNAFYQGRPAPVLAAAVDDWRRVFEVNLFGAMNMVRAVAEPMRRRRAGSIVLVNSDQAWLTLPGFAAYAASKGALVNLTRALAAELGPDGIRVNAVHPGMILADSLRQHFARLAAQQGTSAEAMLRDIAARNPLGYIPGPDDIAGTLLYLASDLARPVTGQSIAVNAGACFH